ncbi:MAG: hypothetical protein ACOCVL_04005, partial [Candidatus Sumerlaeota bacterium]
KKKRLFNEFGELISARPCSEGYEDIDRAPSHPIHPPTALPVKAADLPENFGNFQTNKACSYLWKTVAYW